MILSITHCAACWRDHDVDFKRLRKPKRLAGHDGTCTMVGTCSNTGREIYVFIPDENKPESPKPGGKP